MIENKMYLLAADLIKKRYPKGWGETADDAIIIDNSGDDPDEMVEYLRNIVESCR